MKFFSTLQDKKVELTMLDIIRRLLLKNRTIVSSDIEECMDIISEKYPIKLNKFPTGTEYQTWPIPPEWNVIKAVLLFGDTVIASHDESPLFVARYSLPFSGTINKQQLVEHTFTNPACPDAFCYEFRLAYNYQRRLKEWRIALPHNRLDALPDGDYQLDIDVEVKPGEMIIAESSHQGKSGYWFTFLAHYCHVAQANDGLAGVAVMLEALDKIRSKYPNPYFGYKALLMPETIGSSVYASTHEAELDATIGAVFSEMGGADSPLQLVFSRRGDTYIDRVFLHVLGKLGKLPSRTIPFRKGWGNDELVFDAPGIGVPVVSLDRYPFEAYHTHHDNMDLIKLDKLEEVVDILVAVADAIEEDYIPRPKHRVPPYLTRYDLYSDWTNQRALYDTNTLLLDNMWSGLSVIDIALKHNLDVNLVHSYYMRLFDHKIIYKDGLTPEYSRTVRFLPSS
jgi:aminopeptidase-like protein